MRTIDLNCDMGEFPEAIAGGTQESLMPFINSVNIACGGHAGDERTIRQTVQQAIRWKLALGAHPGYPDPDNFGRVELDIPCEQVMEFVFQQVSFFDGIIRSLGGETVHVKPHGALYNQAVRNRDLAGAIAAGVARWRKDVVLVGLAESPMLDVFRDSGFSVAAEAFADRRYESDGALRPRKHADSLLSDPEEAARQAVRIASTGTVQAWDGSEVPVRAQTICIHGDTPDAARIAAAVKLALEQNGIATGPFRPIQTA